MVCYYGTWAVYRPGNGKFDVENIDPFLCTTIIYGFTGLSEDNTIQCLDPWNDLYDGGGKGALYRFTGLKKQNPALKALVAIGGWNEGSEKFSRVCSNKSPTQFHSDLILYFIIRWSLSLLKERNLFDRLYLSFKHMVLTVWISIGNTPRLEVVSQLTR